MSTGDGVTAVCVPCAKGRDGERWGMKGWREMERGGIGP